MCVTESNLTKLEMISAPENSLTLSFYSLNQHVLVQ